jgi:hypothetical protein
MKIALVMVFLAACAFAQDLPASTAACGHDDVSFKVKLNHSAHTVSHPDPGQARVYFIADAGTSVTLGYPTVKMAMDGAWVGANHGNSYFSVSLAPGEHHICVALQSSMVAPRVELAHFTAEAEKVYFYRTRLVLSRGIELLGLDPLDSDQGRYLVATFPLSVSTPRK